MKFFRTECTNCKSPIALAVSDEIVAMSCGVCQTDVRYEMFPALLEDRPEGRSGETLLVPDESSCFYHPSKKAVVPCDECGRFLCALCEIDMHDRPLCAACIEKGVVTGKIEHLMNQTIAHDRIALSISILSILLCWASVITAPIVLVYSAINWKKPLSAVSRNRWRFVLAILIASFQLIGWGLAALSIMGNL